RRRAQDGARPGAGAGLRHRGWGGRRAGKGMIRPMERALLLAEEAAAQGEVPVGAVIVCDGEVIAAEANRMRALADPTAHAEMLAIRSALKRRGSGRLDGCDLYVT